MEEKIGNINKTTNYKQFKFIKGNRTVNKQHITKLKTSMEKNFVISPILVDKNFYIIDGQHRFYACVELNLPIYYIITTATIEDTKQLNTTQKSWIGIDFFNYDKQFYPEYYKIEEIFNLYPMFSKAVILRCIDIHYANKVRNNVCLNINTENIEKLKHNLNKILDLKEFCTFYKERNFVYAYIKVLNNEEFQHERFLNKLSYVGNLFKKQINIYEYVKLFEYIYNFKQTHKINLI